MTIALKEIDLSERDAENITDIERIAVVGENRWEKGMTIFFKPFTAAVVRYFDSASLDEAGKWLRET